MGGDELLVELAAALDGALLGLVVHVDQAEAGGGALDPLPVVAEAPVVVALNGEVALAQGLQVLGDVAGAEAVCIVAGSVFGDIDGTGEEVVELLADLDDALRVDLPAEVVGGSVLRRAVGGAADGGAGIVVDAVEVAVAAGDDGGMTANGEG